MKNLVLQFAYATKITATHGDIVNVFEEAEIIENPSPNAMLAMLKLTGFDDFIDSEMLFYAMAEPYVSENSEETINRIGRLDVSLLPQSVQDDLSNSRIAEITAADGLTSIYDRGTGNYFSIDSFSG